MSASPEPRPSRQAITQLLLDWSGGNRQALDALMPLVAAELHRLARGYLHRESKGHTLQPTALVNELYLRLVDRRKVSWNNRAHFFGFAAQTMRRILVDHARAQRTDKRGKNVHKISIDEQLDVSIQRDIDLVALDDALETLATLDARQSRIVELRFFGGLTLDETAEVMDVGVATVSRDWASAKAWLYRELRRT